MKTKKHLIISGRVQGVWFRASTKQKANQLGLTGWVQNTDNGKVEAVIEGEEISIKEMIKWCQHGPSMARVEKVEIKDEKTTDSYTDFSIKYQR
jgi:acylphosphatase